MVDVGFSFISITEDPSAVHAFPLDQEFGVRVVLTPYDSTRGMLPGSEEG
jgi:hypothetical protein